MNSEKKIPASTDLIFRILSAGAAMSPAPVLWSAHGTRPTVLYFFEIAQREWRYLALLCALIVVAQVVSLRHLGGAILAAIMLPFWVIGTVSASILINEKLDASAADAHMTRVVSKYEKRGKHESCHIEVRDWRPRFKSVYVEVPCNSEYWNYQSGQMVKVGTRPGRLGFEWIESVNGKPMPGWQ